MMQCYKKTQIMPVYKMFCLMRYNMSLGSIMGLTVNKLRTQNCLKLPGFTLFGKKTAIFDMYSTCTCKVKKIL